ncbi:hypothetical protein FAI41_03980 [Acetobacteraceae bacterium]|nr:hypothetical protein FAI41_03980 [Acetobacteraceae bacterium]
MESNPSEILEKIGLLLQKSYQTAFEAYEKALKSKILAERVYQLDQADKILSKAYLRLAQAGMKKLPLRAIEADFAPKAEKLKETIAHARKIALKTLDKAPLKKLFIESFSKDRKTFSQLCLLFISDKVLEEKLLSSFDAQDEVEFKALLERL